MKRTISIILVLVGLMNLYPITGVLSADALTNLYGVTVIDNDLLILMKHRAVMLGIIGIFMVIAAFRPNLQSAAIVAGLTSMMAFVVLTLGTGNSGELVNKVAAIVGGKGGGRPDMAQAGGSMPDKLKEAISAVNEHVSNLLSA